MGDDFKNKIAFSLVKGMQGDAAKKMLGSLSCVDDFFRLSSHELAVLVGFNSPIFADDYRQAVLAQAADELRFIEHNNIRARFIGDADYPTRLSQCSDAPAMVYSLGQANIDCPYSVAIVGTRHATPYGIDFTQHLVADLAKMLPGILIVSGLAYGIDVAAHRAAIAAGTPTAAVFAHGLSTIYPADHRQTAANIATRNGGLLVTEYTSKYQINRGSFLARNRIIAGLADCVIVVESDLRGGSMSTARIASLYGRDVFALPGRINDKYSRGTNRLIANSTAALITSAQDVASHMGWQSLFSSAEMAQESAGSSSPLSPELQSIYDFVVANPDLTVNDICVRLGLPMSVISDKLFQLEMDDRIIQLPGGRYAPSTHGN